MAEGLRDRLLALGSRPAADAVEVPFRYGINMVPGGHRLPAAAWRYRPGAQAARPVRPRATAEVGASRRVGPARPPRLRLGELLIASGVINAQQLDEALAQQRVTGRRLGHVLLVLKVINEVDLGVTLARQLGVPFLDMSDHVVDPSIAKLVPERIATLAALIPVNKVGNVLTVAMADPLDVIALDDIQLMTGRTVRTVIATEHQVRRAIHETHGYHTQLDRVFGDIEKDIASDRARAAAEGGALDAFEEPCDYYAPIIQLVNQILVNAIETGCSAIYLEPFERELRVRCRRDGVLHVEMTPPKAAQEAIIQRIKILAEMDFTRTRPQTGVIRLRLNNRLRYLGVATQPTPHGELVVIDVHGGRQRALDDLGLEPGARRLLLERASRRAALILLAGGQRSGRSTTLHALARQLNIVGLHIILMEDRPRVNVHGITQIECRSTEPAARAGAMKSVRDLRPDVLMLDDIPDAESAALVADALDAGITVIARLNAPDAAAAIERLRALSSGPRSLAAHVSTICTQRLVRMLCTECRRDWPPPRHVLDELGATPELLARAGRPDVDPGQPVLSISEGCDSCRHTGYHGRTGVFEVMAVSAQNRRAVDSDLPAVDLVRMAIEQGTVPLAEAALRKLLQGVTSVEEVLHGDWLPGLRAAHAFDDTARVEPEPPAEPSAVTPLPNLRLVLRQENRVVWQCPLREGSTSIGVRDGLVGIEPDGDLTAHDAAGVVAPIHLQVIVEASQLWVSDQLGSTGTHLNGRVLSKMKRKAAKPGDRLTLAGRLTLVIEEDDPVTVPA